MAKKQDFLGKGWSFRPTFSKGGAQVEMVSGADNVHKSIRIILQTNLGERVFREDFGCGLNGYVFERINDRLVKNIREMIRHAILRYEPRVKLEEVRVFQDQSQLGLLNIELQYLVKTTNSRYNMVFPFDLNAAQII